MGEKYWAFSQSGPNLGLVTQYQGRQLPGPVVQMQYGYLWTQDGVGNNYIGSVGVTTDGVPIKITNQNLDNWGNQTAMVTFDGNSNVLRTQNNSYLSSGNYTSLHIYNRLVSSTEYDNYNYTATLVSNTYDGGSLSSVSPAPGEWDTSYANIAYRGNVTSSTTPGNSSTYTYDQTGTVTTATQNGIAVAVTTNSSTNYAAPSAITASTLNTTLSYNTFLGLTNQTAPNNATASITYDGEARPTSSTSPFGAVTNYTYNPSPISPSNPATVTATVNGRWTTTTSDGLGRTVKVVTGNGTQTVSEVDTVYGSCGCSPAGKMISQTLPYAPGATPTVTTYTYDGIGRTLSVSTVGTDASTKTTYSYAGNVVTTTDAAGNWKTFTTDPFGHLVTVTEPDPANPTGATYVTSYTYDVLDRLVGVSMPRPTGTQTRAFNYGISNSAVGGLLMWETNPENGKVTYTYNANNQLATKTDAKGQQFSYSYDGVGRMTQVVIGGVGPVTYSYDTNPYDTGGYSQNVLGRLAAVSYGAVNDNGDSVEEWYSYSTAGSLVGKQLVVRRGYATGSLAASWTYDNEGRTTSVSYPNWAYSGSYYAYGYDAMGRLNTMTGPDGLMVSGVTYTASNAIGQITSWPQASAVSW